MHPCKLEYRHSIMRFLHFQLLKHHKIHFIPSLTRQPRERRFYVSILRRQVLQFDFIKIYFTRIFGHAISPRSGLLHINEIFYYVFENHPCLFGVFGNLFRGWSSCF